MPSEMEEFADLCWEKLSELDEFVNGNAPTFKTAAEDIINGTQYFLEAENGPFTPAQFVTDLKKYSSFDLEKDLTAVLGLALGWTVLRYLLTVLFFRPIANYFQLMPLNIKKYPESIWKFLVYTGLWGFTCYNIFVIEENTHIFFDPQSLWKDYTPGMPMLYSVYLCYMLQLSFYIHSVYATFLMDQWRDDTFVMVFHHFLTISLIGFSYLARYHKIGLLVLFVHDITDICLEFTKCNVYFKKRGGKFYRFHDILSTVGFLSFAVAWVLFRLYWFPLKVLHSTGHGTMLRHLKTKTLPFYFFFNGMLWTLQILQVYWFMFIAIFLVKVLTGQINEVDDIREVEVKEELFINKKKKK